MSVNISTISQTVDTTSTFVEALSAGGESIAITASAINIGTTHRIVADGNNLKVQYNDSGTWTDMGTFEP